MGLEFGML